MGERRLCKAEVGGSSPPGSTSWDRLMWWVYVLKSLKNGRLYIGSTNDLERRLAEHNSGKNKYTRHVRPLQLVYNEVCDGRLEARRRESYLKSGQGREFLKLKIREYAS